MSPDDTRHGTYAGAVAHWKHDGDLCQPCRDAATRYRKRLRYERHVNGHGRLLPNIGYRRRIEALQAIGWPLSRIADELGVYIGTLSNRYYRARWVSVANFEALAEFYERVCMTPLTGPTVTRTVRNAERKGYAPPLAWDDIDNDPEPVRVAAEKRREAPLDDVAIERRLLGDKTVRLTKPERIEAVRRWLRRGGSLNGFELHTGIAQSHRYLKEIA